MIARRLMIGLCGILCVLVIAIVAMFAGWLTSNKGEVLILNEAPESVVRGEIEICSQRFNLQEIKPKKSEQILFKVGTDSHYRVVVEFASGKKLTKNIGYVTTGRDVKDTLVVTDDDIALRESTLCRNLDRGEDCTTATYNLDGSVNSIKPGRSK